MDTADTAGNLLRAYEKLAAGLSELTAHQVRAILHTGDLIEDSQASTEDEFDAVFNRAASFLDQAKLPWFMTPGDHDVNPPKNLTPDSQDRTYEGYFQRAYSKREPRVRSTLYYSFDIEHYHFIALNSLEHLRTDPRWGDVFLSELSNAQYQWLQDDLRSHREATGIVVFMHQPLWYNWTAWMKVHELLRQYPVQAVIAGHFHYNQDDGTLDGIHYLIVGALGAEVKQGTSSAGNLHHVSILTLHPHAAAEISLIPIAPANDRPSFGSRTDMDRVQALDVMLDGYYYKNYDQFGPYNPLCVIDGKLYSNVAKAPPILRLLPVGNPTDVPIKVITKLTSPGWSLDHPSFRIGTTGCTTQPDGSCNLGPGVGIYTSNNSSVTLPEPKDTTPLWQSGLEPASMPVKPNSPVTLELRIAFTGANGSYELYRVVRSVTSATCK